MNADPTMQMFVLFSGLTVFSLMVLLFHPELNVDSSLPTASITSSIIRRRSSSSTKKDPISGEKTEYLDGVTLSLTGDLESNKSWTNNSGRKNVLFIIVDGLRPQTGAYDDPEHPDYFGKVKIHTPNLDKLASESMVFRHAYVQYSLCGPSRTSLLTSRRPDVTRVYNNRAYWREKVGNFTTLPQHFKNNGYLTVGLGKVFHVRDSLNYYDKPSWSEPFYLPPHTDGQFPTDGDFNENWASVSEQQAENVPLIDISTTRMARSILRNLSAEARTGRRHFFMAVGYHKPHLRLVCPEKYYSLYALEDEDQFLANKSWQTLTLDPHKNLQGSELVDGRRVLPSDVLRRLRRAYFACISYVDGLVGELRQQLEDCGLAGNTVVSFVADHGFHLGENGRWGKKAVSEIANRVPMMIRVPGLTDAGMTSSAIVEALDLFPTLVEAAGLEAVPTCPPAESSAVPLCTQGTSLMALLRDPDYKVKDVALSQIMQPSHVLYTIRTRSFRLVDPAFFVNTTERCHRLRQPLQWPTNTTYTKLYDHTNDLLEEVNLADNPNYRTVLDSLRKMLHQFVDNQFATD